MQNLLKVVITMGVLSVLSSVIGGFIGGVIKVKSKDKIASLFQITAGIMTGIVCFDMLPESFEMANLATNILGLFLGVILVYIIDVFSENDMKSKKYSSTTISIMLSMSLHNIVEGLAIGSGFSHSINLGMTLLISIFLHDIPEGIVIGITNKIDKLSLKRVILNSVFVGFSTVIGGIISIFFSNINSFGVAFCLAFSAGAMLYIVACDLLPSSNKYSTKRHVSIMYICGILIGEFITKI